MAGTSFRLLRRLAPRAKAVITLRRDLAMVLGESHADYQKLRTERAEIADPEDG